MRQFLITIIATIIGMFLFIFLFFVGLAAIASSAATDERSAAEAITGDTVLSLDLREIIQDNNTGNDLFSSANAIINIACALNSAKTDNNIKGLVIRARPFGMTPASAEELRLAILDFKTSGKFVVTHSQGFEDTSLTGYMAISASDEIWQQSASNFSVAGISSETPFYGGVFEKFDAKPEFIQFHEYKNMGDSYTQTDFTKAHKEAATSLLQSIYELGTSYIAKDRELTVDELKTVLDNSPYNSTTAKEAGLIDQIGYWSDLQNYIKTKTRNEDIDFKDISYMECDAKSSNAIGRDTIALIGAEGPILTGEAVPVGPFGMENSISSSTISKAIDEATEDKSVKAIIIRVSSPGGTVTGSDEIYGAVLRAKENNVPVIISMGQYAASGGYYISAPADHIVAMPMTITGSIGVVGGKIALRDAYAKLGYNVERIAIGGDYLGAYSVDTPFTNAQRTKFYSQLEDMYERFTGLVAEGRDIPIEKVKEVAKGRVWTGSQAKDHGLVDSLGGIMSAIDIAKELGSIQPDEKIKLAIYPKPKTFFERLSIRLGTVSTMIDDMRFIGQIRQMPEIQAALNARTATDLAQNGSYISDMPIFDVP